jgi:hypothetical protein
MSDTAAPTTAFTADMFPILTAPAVVAGAARTVPRGTLAYVNLLAEAAVRHSSSTYRGAIDTAASARRSTVYAGVGAAFVRQHGK